MLVTGFNQIWRRFKNARMDNYKSELTQQFAKSHRLEEEIMKQLHALKFNTNVGEQRYDK